MGKQGPCYHCGVTSTPLWRNGPPDKPVLCNACGSRWRTKGTLTNYTPLHARTDHDDYEEHKVSKGKSITISRIKEVKVLKRKLNHETGVIGGFVSDSYQSFSKAMDEDTSNRSSSGSAISNSESCAQFGNDASDLTGPAQSTVWDTMVPSKKRTCVNRPKQSSVEKLTKELYTIWYEQQQQSSNFSGSSEEDLLFESERPMVSVEIGHGSVLIRHPSSIAREEESEASSLSVDNKMLSTNEAYSHSAINKLHILANHNSPIRDADLKNVLNFDEFMSQLTPEEQKELMKYLPWIDSIKPPDSLKVMFESPQLNESLTSFQQLLAEGVFDSSLPGVKKEDCNSLRRLALFNLSKSQWVECYNQLKEPTSSSRGSDVSGANGLTLNSLMNGKRSYDSEIQNFPEAKKTTMKSPKRMMTKASFDNKDLSESDGSYYSPRSLFALPTDGSSSLMLESFHFVGETSDQGLLLDVKSNSSSFLQAELL